MVTVNLFPGERLTETKPALSSIFKARRVAWREPSPDKFSRDTFAVDDLFKPA
jgi:hypothetical protein